MKIFLVPLFVLVYSLVAYGAPPDYEAREAECKRTYQWDEIEKSKWPALPPLDGKGWASILKSLKALFNLAKSFDHYSDETPEGRVKFIHAYGVVGKVHLEIDLESPYTGLLQSTAPGILRLSLAGDPAEMAYTPGMALKLYIDGHASANIVAMPSLDGQDENTDFFAHAFMTAVEPPTSSILKLLSWWFSCTESEPEKLSVMEFVTTTPDGSSEQEANGPSILSFVPTEEVANKISSASSHDFRESLIESVMPGPIYKVYGKSSRDSDGVYVGQLILEEPLLASEYGDKHLFFRHQRK